MKKSAARRCSSAARGTCTTLARCWCSLLLLACYLPNVHTHTKIVNGIHVPEGVTCCNHNPAGAEPNFCSFNRYNLALDSWPHQGWDHVVCCDSSGQMNTHRGFVEFHYNVNNYVWKRGITCETCNLNEALIWDHTYLYHTQGYEQYVCVKKTTAVACSLAGCEGCTAPDCYCEAGQFLHTYVGSTRKCQKCQPGQYQDSTNHVAIACKDCGAGKYHGSSSDGLSSCFDCLRGTFPRQPYEAEIVPIGTAAEVCSNCAKGKYGSSAGVCTDCDAGKYTDALGSLECLSCFRGRYEVGRTECKVCAEGKFQPDDFKTECIACVPGKKASAGINVQCSNCPAGQSSVAEASVCSNCVAGKSSVSGEVCLTCVWNHYAAAGAAPCVRCPTGQYSVPPGPCASCADGQFMNIKYQELSPGKDVALAGDPCKQCAACPVAGEERVACIRSTTSEGVCMACPLSGQKLNLVTAVCELCPANEYYDATTTTRARSSACFTCPENSRSPSGSKSLQACVCNNGFLRVDMDNTDNNFVCGCEFGKYLTPGKCEECAKCGRGQYMSGCTGNNAGSCRQCDKSCNLGYYLAGCGGLHEGVCKKMTDLVRTPQCPAATDSMTSSAGFGFYDFNSVFKVPEDVLNFRCSNVCDGRTNEDTVQCDGPYACNMATCAEQVAEEGNMIPVRACPVVITDDDDEETRQLKRSENCVSCRACGHERYQQGISLYSDWGAGCVRECSQLRCDNNQVWDWTRKLCSTCEALSDMRLCHRRDVESMGLQQRRVTGNRPLLYFVGCQGGGRNLLEIGYGTCQQCDQHSSSTRLQQTPPPCSGAGSQQLFPARCQDRAIVLCDVCSWKQQSLYVDVLQGRWHTGEHWSALHCQISACKQRQGGAWTGVDSSGRVCRRLCTPLECGAGEMLVPCRLPHQARCEAVFPAPTSVDPDMRATALVECRLGVGTLSCHAGGEVNLLNEADEQHWRRVASFENILMVLPSNAEYQCVWNADGIIDNVATPAGLSHVLWAPGQSADDLYNERGTRACRVWDVDEDVEMPVLPLQNTVACSEEEDASSQCLDRRMLVNTEAYALSYHFSGDFGIGSEQGAKINAQFTESFAAESSSSSAAEPGPRMLRGEHVGGEGRLFLMLRMHQRRALLAVNVPDDRALHNATWLRSLIVSFAVVDVTEYEDAEAHANVRVGASMTVQGQEISDDADSFVPEVFWAQPVSSANANPAQTLSTAHEKSLFGVDLHGVGDSTRCEAQAVPVVAQLSLAPWTDAAADPAVGAMLTQHSWMQQRNGSAMLCEASVACLINERPSVLCNELQNVADVFVLTRAYEFRAPAAAVPEGGAQCHAPLAMCAETMDKTLLGLRNVHRHMQGAPAADRLVSGNAARVHYYMRNMDTVQVHIQQAHAVGAYSKCALLLTLSLRTEEQNVVCVGADGPLTVKERLPASKYCGAFSTVVDGRRVFVQLLRSVNEFASSLQWQDTVADPDALFSTVECSAGKGLVAFEGRVFCNACEHGKYAFAGDNECRLCPAGMFSSSGALCQYCAAGKYSNAGAHSCTACAFGKYSSVGQAACTSTSPSNCVDSSSWRGFRTPSQIEGQQHTCATYRPGGVNDFVMSGTLQHLCFSDYMEGMTSRATCTQCCSSCYTSCCANNGICPSAVSSDAPVSAPPTAIPRSQTDPSVDRFSVVGGSDTVAASWVSVDIIDELITALHCKAAGSSLSVQFFLLTLSPALPSPALALQKRAAAVSLGDDWNVAADTNPWLDYARVVASRETDNVLVACVETQTSEELLSSELQSSILVLRVCVGSPSGFACANVTIAENEPSFISAAFLQRRVVAAGSEELWAVSVHGKSHTAIFSQSQRTIALRREQVSDLENKHFVKVDHLFYCFVISGTVGSAGMSPSVLTYLPHFQRWRPTGDETLPSAYAVVVIPAAVTATSTTIAYTEGTSSRFLQKTLRLQLRWASYRVSAAAHPAQPLFERVADSPPGNPATQLIVSQHVVNPRSRAESSFLASYAIAANNLTLNRALGLPSAYGRYELAGAQCVFRHYPGNYPSDGDPSNGSNADPSNADPSNADPSNADPSNVGTCVEDTYPPILVSGASCESDSLINGLYRYYNWKDPLVVEQAGALPITNEDNLLFRLALEDSPVYALRSTCSSPKLPPQHRYLYRHKVTGWMISGILGYSWSATSPCNALSGSVQSPLTPGHCGIIKARWLSSINADQPPATSPIQMCKAQFAYAGMMPLPNLIITQRLYVGDLWTSYDVRTAALQLTAAPLCCAAGKTKAAAECLCSDCAPGSYSAAGSLECTFCELGKYAAAVRSTSCLRCAPGTQTPKPGAVECIPGAQALGVALRFQPRNWAPETGRWLLLQFTVPCGVRLQPFPSVLGGVCELGAVAGSPPLCPEHPRVVVLVDAGRVASTKVYYLGFGALLARVQTLILPHSDCVYVEQGAFWVDAAAYAHAPADHEIEALLRRAATVPAPPQQLSGEQAASWRRQRHVLSITPRENMRVELLFERDAVADSSVRVSVGVDDVQLAPVLSSFPAVQGLGGELCAMVRVPNAAELATVGLAHLLRGSNSTHDDWERLHSTVGLSTGPAQEGCVYTATLFYALGDGDCTPDPAQPQDTHSLHRLGCSLAPAARHVLGAYAECQIELPAFLVALGVAELPLGVAQLRLGVKVTPNSSDVACALDTAELVVSLRPHTQLYSCAPGQFLDVSLGCTSCHAPRDSSPEPTSCKDDLSVFGMNMCLFYASSPETYCMAADMFGNKPLCSKCCITCHNECCMKNGICPTSEQSTTSSVCAPGFRLRGCPALEPAVAANCVPCVEGRELVLSGAAEYLPDDSQPCAWNCSLGFFEFEMLGARTCKSCSQPPAAGCIAGEEWRDCDSAHDAGCVPCPDLRRSAGPYAAFAMYLDPVNQSNTCQTRCTAGAYRAHDGLCKPCWGRKQLLLHAGVGLFFFQACSDSSNAQALACVPQNGELILESDPGEGTTAAPFLGQCITRCQDGWYKSEHACVTCPPPLQFVDGEATQIHLPAQAFAWLSNSSTPCAFTCHPPYRKSGAGPTDPCVLCSGTCPTGSYPVAPYCKCASCIM